MDTSRIRELMSRLEMELTTSEKQLDLAGNALSGVRHWLMELEDAVSEHKAKNPGPESDPMHGAQPMQRIAMDAQEDREREMAIAGRYCSPSAREYPTLTEMMITPRNVLRFAPRQGGKTLAGKEFKRALERGDFDPEKPVA